MRRVDVAIVGGGMVGASLALALSGSGREVVLIEGVAPGAASQPSFDDRSTALGNASRRIFDALGVWRAMEPDATPIRTIHVSDAGRFGFARLNAAEQGIEAFGYIVPNRCIGAALWAARTRDELSATGETVRKRDVGALDMLTAQELRMARLVAAGSSNKDVAAHLFLSSRTVEYHLGKVFTKLGVASRVELAHAGLEPSPTG